MAFVTVPYDLESPRRFIIPNPFGFNGILRAASFMAAGLAAGVCLIAALGAVEVMLPAVMPLAPVMRRAPSALPRQLAVVNQRIGTAHIVRQKFIDAYTGDNGYSNLDWRRNKAVDDASIIADVGPNSVIEDMAVTERVVEPREERATTSNSAQYVVPPKFFAVAATAAKAAVDEQGIKNDLQLASVAMLPIPLAAPAARANEAVDQSDAVISLPDTVPFPGRKPSIVKPDKEVNPTLAYAPPSGRTEDFRGGIVGRLFGHVARNKTAIYDISAGIVYMPSGEKLEAHSGIGHMRDNPRFVDQKMRGATPPSTYNLKMRERLFHGVEAVRLLPADGRNPHNRDGLLAHTYMLRRAGDSNGCVVFKDYARFLRAFKRGEVNKMVVVNSVAGITNNKYM